MTKKKVTKPLISFRLETDEYKVISKCIPRGMSVNSAIKAFFLARIKNPSSLLRDMESTIK